MPAPFVDTNVLLYRLADAYGPDAPRRAVAHAIAASQRFRIPYWDAAIIEAARLLGCQTVLSDELDDGRDSDGVSVEDPFCGV